MGRWSKFFLASVDGIVTGGKKEVRPQFDVQNLCC